MMPTGTMEMETERRRSWGMGPAPKHPTDPQRPHSVCRKTRPTPGMPNRGHLIQGVSHKGMGRTGGERRRDEKESSYRSDTDALGCIPSLFSLLHC